MAFEELSVANEKLFQSRRSAMSLEEVKGLGGLVIGSLDELPDPKITVGPYFRSGAELQQAAEAMQTELMANVRKAKEEHNG